MNIDEYKGILVFIEQENNKLSEVSLELLGEANNISLISKESVIAVVLGSDVEGIAQECIFYGADIVWYSNSRFLEEYLTEPYTATLEYIINKIKPNTVLLGATFVGRDLAPRLSARLHTGLTADCTHLALKTDDNGEPDSQRTMLMTRPAYGGYLIATIICTSHRPQMATVRPSVMEAFLRDESRKGEVKEFTYHLEDSHFRVEILETVKEEVKEKHLKEESVLVVGGNGIKTVNTYKKLFELALYLGGGVGVARSLVEKNWATHSRQIGQTGTHVRPTLYLSFGVSGAIQHITGMEKSNFIIAVNKDRKAPIFKFAHIGIIANLEIILPKLLEKIKISK